MQQCDSTLHIPLPQMDFHLPRAWSLFCHNKVYYTIPERFTGLCSLGQVGLLKLPNPKSQQKRDLLHLSQDCNDNVILLSEADTVALTLSLVGLLGLTLGLQHEISKTVCLLSRT